MSGPNGNEAVGAVTVFAPISHPVLKSVNPVSVSTFLRERERYEKQVDEKRAELPTLTPAEYKVSIDMGLLETMVFLGKFDSIAPETKDTDLTSQHIKTFIENLIKSWSAGFQPSVVQTR